jgi:hypothetical protein
MRALISIIAWCAFAIAFAQRPSPAPAQTRSVLVKGGTIHVGDGRTFDDGAVGFRNGTIDFVGYEYAVKAAYDTVIDAKGKQVYPGFILPDATLGLVEIDAVHASEDEAELGDMEPEVRALSAYNTDSQIIPTVRDNGVLLAQITPRGNTISGTSSIVQLDAWNNNDAPVRKDDGVHLNWPVAFETTGWWAEQGSTEKEDSEKRTKTLAQLNELFPTGQGICWNIFSGKNRPATGCHARIIQRRQGVVRACQRRTRDPRSRAVRPRHGREAHGACGRT